jgi:hypothetical protein
MDGGARDLKLNVARDAKLVTTTQSQSFSLAPACQTGQPW